MKRGTQHFGFTAWLTRVLVLSLLLPHSSFLSDIIHHHSFQWNARAAAAQPCGNGGQGGGCKNCGGGQGQGGQQAAQMLLGIAAIMAPITAAVAQASAASQKAKADKYIADRSADAAIRQTQIQAATTRELAENQRIVAEQNTRATMELAQRQQDASTERLVMQLQALEKEREKAAAERAEIRAIEEKRSQQAIALAKEQSEKNLQLAKLQLYNKYVSDSLVPSSTSTSRLGVTQISSDRSGGTPLTSSNPLSRTLGVMESNSQPPSASNARPTIVRGANRGVSENQPIPAETTRKTASSELLVSSLKKEDAAVHSLAGAPRGAAPNMNPMMGGSGTALLSQSYVYDRAEVVPTAQRGLVSGSTRGAHRRGASSSGARPTIQRSQPSELQQFSRAVARNQNHSFTEYLETEKPVLPTSAHSQRAAAPSHGNSGKYQGYNAPDTVSVPQRASGRYLADF